jgi:hypothetical protein
MKEDDEGIRFHTLLTAGMVEFGRRRGGDGSVHGGGLQAISAVQEEAQGAAHGLPRRGAGRG